MNLHGWIPVTERLPKNDGIMLVCDGSEWTTAQYIRVHDVHLWVAHSPRFSVLYWKPAPELPEVEAKEPETISDGLGNTWAKRCPDCGQDTMEVVRPGKVQCAKCG